MGDGAFQEWLKRVRQSPSRSELASAIQAGLKALLQQPGDRELLQSLLAQADALTRRLPDNTGDQTPEVRQAAVRCVVLLETAQKGRQKKKDLWIPILLAVAAAVAVFYALLLL